MIHTENTPNPNAIKFLSDNVISSIGTKEFHRKFWKNFSGSQRNQEKRARAFVSK